MGAFSFSVFTREMLVDGHAHHLRLPESAWLKRLTEDASVTCSFDFVRLVQSQKYKLTGLVNLDLSQIRPWQGSLTSWSQEAFALHDYYHNPTDSFVVRATSAYAFEEERSMYRKMDQRQRERAQSTAPMASFSHQVCVLQSWANVSVLW